MRKKGDFPSEDFEDVMCGGESNGTRALLGAVLGQAVRDLTRKECAKASWPGLKINAAKWILGIGKESGNGISIDDVADGLGVNGDEIARAIGAEERLESLIRAKAERRANQARERRGLSFEFEEIAYA